MTFRETALDDEIIDIPSSEAEVDLAKINTLHELLALAIGDFEKVIANPRYSINLNVWHEPLDNGKCQVCLAGSVMAMHLGTSPTTDRTAGYRDHSTWKPETEAVQHRLYALNSLRQGNILVAANLLSRCDLSGVLDVNKKWYHKVRCSNARTRPQARLLLADLKLMQRDLERTGL